MAVPIVTINYSFVGISKISGDSWWFGDAGSLGMFEDRRLLLLAGTLT